MALDGSNAFAGNMGNPGEVQLVDVAEPAAPVMLGTISTGFAGIGSIAIRGAHVAVGELENITKARIALLDFSSRWAPVTVSSAHTLLTSTPSLGDLPGSPAISSLAFIGPNRVLAASLSDVVIVQADFANANNPIVSVLNPMLAGPVTLDSDEAANRMVVGDSTSGIVKFFSFDPFSHLATVNTELNGVTSLNLFGSTVLVGAAGDFDAAVVDFTASPPTVTRFGTGLQGGNTTAFDGPSMIAAFGNTNIGATDETLVDVSVSPPVVRGRANSTTLLSGIGSLALKSFKSPTIQAPVSSAMLR